MTPADDGEVPKDSLAQIGQEVRDSYTRNKRVMSFDEFFQLFLVFAIAAGVGGLLLGIPSLIAPRRLSVIKMEPFECGKDPVALPEGRFAIKFSTIAIFFIIFDIELLFVWPWATVFKSLGWFGYSIMLVFLGVLMLGFLYIWQKRGLEWE